MQFVHCILFYYLRVKDVVISSGFKKSVESNLMSLLSGSHCRKKYMLSIMQHVVLYEQYTYKQGFWGRSCTLHLFSRANVVSIRVHL